MLRPLAPESSLGSSGHAGPRILSGAFWLEDSDPHSSRMRSGFRIVTRPGKDSGPSISDSGPSIGDPGRADHACSESFRVTAATSTERRSGRPRSTTSRYDSRFGRSSVACPIGSTGCPCGARCGPSTPRCQEHASTRIRPGSWCHRYRTGPTKLAGILREMVAVGNHCPQPLTG